MIYHFQETEFISDINAFILEMRHIAQERNRLFVYKTPQQISELQDAVDYLNQHLNGDLKKIKECVFRICGGLALSIARTVIFRLMIERFKLLGVLRCILKCVEILTQECTNMTGI